MAGLSKLRTGNWLLYTRENQYCTFIAKDDYVVVEMFDRQRRILETEIALIKLTKYFLPSCKFIQYGSDWKKQVNGKTLSLSFKDDYAYLSVDGGKNELVSHLHTLQNLHFVITGEVLNPNIYGIHDPG